MVRDARRVGNKKAGQTRPSSHRSIQCQYIRGQSICEFGFASALGRISIADDF